MGGVGWFHAELLRLPGRHEPELRNGSWRAPVVVARVRPRPRAVPVASEEDVRAVQAVRRGLCGVASGPSRRSGPRPRVRFVVCVLDSPEMVPTYFVAWLHDESGSTRSDELAARLVATPPVVAHEPAHGSSVQEPRRVRSPRRRGGCPPRSWRAVGEPFLPFVHPGDLTHLLEFGRARLFGPVERRVDQIRDRGSRPRGRVPVDV